MPRAELDNDGIRDDFPYLVRGTGNFSVEDLFCLPVRDDLAHAVFRVGSSYNRGKSGKESSLGRIGIVGPTRMNYSQTVSVLNEIVKTLDNFMSNGLLEEDDGGYDG